MRREYYITMDAHSRTTDACVKTKLGKLVKRAHLHTTIPHLTEFIESVPRPRRLALEESSIAGWVVSRSCATWPMRSSFATRAATAM